MSCLVTLVGGDETTRHEFEFVERRGRSLAKE
jgi:hypothetical protein